MAVSSVSQPRDNLLEALRMLVEERKEEVKGVFLELRTELEQCEEGVNKELCELYSDTRERVERDEKKIGKLETAKGNLQTDLVDNEFNSILQTTMDNFDAQIAEIRRSSITIPRYVELEWNKEELKKSIERVCRIVSSNRDSRQSVQTSGVISHPYEEARVLTEQVRFFSAYHSVSHSSYVYAIIILFLLNFFSYLEASIRSSRNSINYQLCNILFLFISSNKLRQKI